MTGIQKRISLHKVIDFLIRYSGALEAVHHADSIEKRRETIGEWSSCHVLVWANPSNRNDSVRSLADPAKAWLANVNSRYVELKDFDLVEECAIVLTSFAVSPFPISMPDMYSKRGTTEEKLSRQWDEQGDRIIALSGYAAKLKDISARAGVVWHPVETEHEGEMIQDDTREYLMKVGALKALLNERARGNQPSEAEYSKLRAELVCIPAIQEALPVFVLTCHTLQEFWIFIKPKFSKWAERTIFLQQEFTPIISWLEGGVAPVRSKSRSEPPRPDLVVVTVNDHETRAVLQAFGNGTGREAIPFPIDDRVYHDLGTLNGTRVFHAISEMGSAGVGAMQQTVEKAIRLLDPGSVIAVGIAFGVNDERQAIGDILLSKQVRLYEMQRRGKKKIVPRGSLPDASPRLTSHFRGFIQTKWRGPSATLGVMLTGEKLVDDPVFRKALLAHDPEAIGGEMEGAGLYVSGYDLKVDWIVIKAICDFADGNKEEGKDARQKLAAENAARFLVEGIRYAPLNRVR